MTDLNGLASIDNKGAILLGELLSCDGRLAEENLRKHFAFSHIHVDHVGGGTGGVCLGDTVYECFHNGQVYVSIPTGELLQAIADEKWTGNKEQYIEMKFGQKGEQEIKGENGKIEKLQLIESNHILGASQIYLYSENHKKHVLYSGDITSKDKPPKDVDALVVDSTHGSPHFDDEADEENVKKQFFEILGEQIRKNNKTIVIHASRGILQEAMSIVSKETSLDRFELLSTKQDIAASKIYQKYGYEMRNIVDFKSDEGYDIKEKDFPCIEFTPQKSKTYGEKYEGNYGIYFDSYVSGYEMRPGVDSTHFKENSHANFTSLINYIIDADADLVVVDGHRTRQGQNLVKELKELDVNAVCQP